MFLYCSAFWVPSLLIALADLPYKAELEDDNYSYVYSVKGLGADNYAVAKDDQDFKLIVNLKCVKAY